MIEGKLIPGLFRHLRDQYQARTGYNLVLSDTNGSIQMGLPDCERFPCMNTCRDCRERIVSEALRTGKVCVDSCHEGYIIWGLPFAVEGKAIGGLIVIGGEQEIRERKEHFEEACRELYHLMRTHDLLPDGSNGSNGHDFTEVHRFVFRKSFNHLSDILKEHGSSFIYCLQTAEFDEAKAHFNRIRNGFEQSADLPVDVIRGLVGDLVFRARQQFADAGIDAYACCSEAGLLLSKIARATEVREVEEILGAFLERFILLSRQRPKDPDEMLVEKATTYLEKNIREELTRESVARAVGISPSHFSRLIREKKGRTFTDLLNQYRIERACKLLVRSSYTLAQIANETGFCDQSYFSKVFRRYKDMTPAKYREAHQL